MFSMSKANSAYGRGTHPQASEEKPVSFHKIVPVKKHRKPVPEPKKWAPKKHARKCPIGREHRR